MGTNGDLCDATTDCGVGGSCSGVCDGGTNDGDDCASQSDCSPFGRCVPPISTCNAAVGQVDSGKNCSTDLDCTDSTCEPNVGECTVEGTHADSEATTLPALGSWAIPLVALMLLTGVWFLRRRFAPSA